MTIDNEIVMLFDKYLTIGSISASTSSLDERGTDIII